MGVSLRVNDENVDLLSSLHRSFDTNKAHLVESPNYYTLAVGRYNFRFIPETGEYDGFDVARPTTAERKYYLSEGESWEDNKTKVVLASIAALVGLVLVTAVRGCT